LRTDRQRIGQAGQWDFNASVRNLFDAEVKEPSVIGTAITGDLPQPGRSFIFEASVAF
jgi:iron complex outermembrane receptor protein